MYFSTFSPNVTRNDLHMIKILNSSIPREEKARWIFFSGGVISGLIQQPIHSKGSGSNDGRKKWPTSGFWVTVTVTCGVCVCLNGFSCVGACQRHYSELCVYPVLPVRWRIWTRTEIWTVRSNKEPFPLAHSAAILISLTSALQNLEEKTTLISVC